MRVDTERRARKHHKVGVFVFFQGTEPGIQVHHFRWVQGQSFEGVGIAHAAAYSYGTGAQHEARFGDVIVGIDGDQHAGLCQDRGILFDQADYFGFAARAVHERERCWDLALRQLFGHAVAFGGVLQNQLEAELLGNTHGRHEIISAVTVKVNRALPLQHFDERFQSRIGFGHRAGFAIGFRFAKLGPFLLVIACFDELLALERSDFHARERCLAAAAVALGVLAISHLQAAENGHIGNAHLLDGVSAKLDVDGLAADDVAAAGHDIGGGDAAGLGHANAGIVGPDGVESAQAGLDWATHFVAVAMSRHRRPRIDADV